MTGGSTAFDLYRNGDLPGAEAQARSELGSCDDPMLRYLLGLLLCRRGALEDGLEELRRARAAAPGHPGIFVAFVRALIDLGRGSEALQEARRPASGSPAAAELWSLRAEAAEAAGEPADRWEALHEADLALARGALARQPGNPELELQVARLLVALGRDGEAEPILRKLTRQSPADARAAYELALLLERSNQLDEARATIAAAVAGGADAGDFPLVEALLAWRDGEPETCLAKLEEAGAERNSLRAKQLETKARDSLGDAEGAFAAAEAQKLAVDGRDEWRVRSARFRQSLRTNAALLTSDFAAGVDCTNGQSGPAPVFLVGFPRSGTTLLDTFLMGHARIQVVEEVPALGLAAERLGSVERLASLGQDEAAELRHLYFTALGHQAPQVARLLVDKLPLNMVHAPLIARLFPNARIIFAERHPCDCVLSGFFQNFALNPAMACFLDIGDAADLYDAAMELWMRSRELFPLTVHAVRYERLVEQPEEELRAAVEFLELDWDAALLSHRETARQRGAIGTPSYDQVVQPLNGGPVGRWRRYEEQLAPVLPVLLPWAERLGYRA